MPTAWRLARACWRSLGYSIVTCTSGADALEQFVSHDPFDLVVTDYKMPRMDGLELIGACVSIRRACRSC